MPELALSHRDRSTLPCQVGGVAVTEVVQADPGKARPLHHRPKIPLPDVVQVKWFAVRLAEHQSMIDVAIPQQTALLVLALPQPAELLGEDRRDGHGVIAVGLGAAPNLVTAHTVQLAPGGEAAEREEGVRCEVPLHEPRVGGRYRLIMRLSNGQTLPVAGVYRTIGPPWRLVFTWGWEGDDNQQSLVMITFKDLGGKTELTLRHEGLRTIENRDAHRKDWGSALDKLTGFLTRPGNPRSASV